jgi:hypothetical protein
VAGEPELQEQAGDLDAGVEAAIAACDGDARAAVRALLVASSFLEAELEGCGRSFRAGSRAANSRSRRPAKSECRNDPSPAAPLL